MYGFGFSPKPSGGTQTLSFWYAPRFMIAGTFAADFGRNTSARRRVPSRIGISTSFSMTRSYFGCGGWCFFRLIVLMPVTGKSADWVTKPQQPRPAAAILLRADACVAEDFAELGV